MYANWKPENYNSVSVYIMASGAQRVLDFLKQTFAAAPFAATTIPTAPSCRPKSAWETPSS
jgi:hypothetical protein